jgi:myo-inositol catabolism protein IolS
MEYRTLGKSGIQISEIGFGAWAIGGDAWGPVDDKVSIQAMERALSLGVNFLDTADVYGDGHSEQLVSQVLKGRRDQIILSTKGGLLGHTRKPEPIYDSPEKVIQAFEDSLERLKTDYIDVYFCHIWWQHEKETEAFLTAYDRLKRDGKVRAVGVSTDDINYLKSFNREGAIDVLQVDYSILNRNPEKEILPYCEENGIGVVIRGPLKMGLLTGKFTRDQSFPDGDIRKNWPQEDWFQEGLQKVDKLRFLENDHRTLGQAALQFVLSNPTVSVAIPGGKTAAQVEQNVAASVRPLLSDEELSRISEIA